MENEQKPQKLSLDDCLIDWKNHPAEDEFKFSYFEDIDDALVQGLEQNQEFFSMLLNNPELKTKVLGVFVNEVYKTLKNKGE